MSRTHHVLNELSTHHNLNNSSKYHPTQTLFSTYHEPAMHLLHVTNYMCHEHIAYSISRLNITTHSVLYMLRTQQWVLCISRTIHTSRVSHLNMSRTQWVIYTSQSEQVVYISRTRNESSTCHELYVSRAHHVLNESVTSAYNDDSLSSWRI